MLLESLIRYLPIGPDHPSVAIITLNDYMASFGRQKLRGEYHLTKRGSQYMINEDGISGGDITSEASLGKFGEILPSLFSASVPRYIRHSRLINHERPRTLTLACTMVTPRFRPSGSPVSITRSRMRVEEMTCKICLPNTFPRR